VAGREVRADIHCRALSWLGRHLVWAGGASYRRATASLSRHPPRRRPITADEGG
jgi:hypothetical protein